MMLGICLKGEACVVIASVEEAQRRSYHAHTKALTQKRTGASLSSRA